MSFVNERQHIMREAIREYATTHVYGPGAALFEQGDSAECVYFIQRGLAKIVCASQEGEQTITALRSTGWLLGAHSAILNQPHPQAAVTLTQCTLACLSRRRLLELMRTDRAVSWYVHELQSIEIAELQREQFALRSVTLRERYASLLFRFVSDAGKLRKTGPVELEIPLKKQEMAQFLSVTPEHFSRFTKRLEREGVIRKLRRNSLTIDNPAQLFRSMEAG